MVSPREEMAGHILRHFERMRQPEVSRERANWGVAAAWGVVGGGVSCAGPRARHLSAGVIAVLARSGVTDVIVDGRCTGCDPRRFSHRVSGDRGRQALVAWIDP